MHPVKIAMSIIPKSLGDRIIQGGHTTWVSKLQLSQRKRTTFLDDKAFSDSVGYLNNTKMTDTVRKRFATKKNQIIANTRFLMKSKFWSCYIKDEKAGS